MLSPAKLLSPPFILIVGFLPKPVPGAKAGILEDCGCEPGGNQKSSLKNLLRSFDTSFVRLTGIPLFIISLNLLFSYSGFSALPGRAVFYDALARVDGDFFSSENVSIALVYMVGSATDARARSRRSPVSTVLANYPKQSIMCYYCICIPLVKVDGDIVSGSISTIGFSSIIVVRRASTASAGTVYASLS